MLAQTADPKPTRVGRYLLTGRIGRGGMGMVYRAKDEALDREVALKTLTGEGGLDTERRKRFAIEAKAAAKLGHPNIVIVYELGEDRGVPFIAMEMLPGADLEAVMRGSEPLALSEKLDVLAQVCRGLAFAHERGIVHRDIKPSNIRLLDDGTAKIMDFGIAKLGGTHLTKTGMMVGTVHYMSPEQVRGRPLDGRSDVFSVGVILYEALTGHRPFAGESATQVLYKIVNEDPAPLSLDAVGEVGPRLTAVLRKALAKDPDARYPSAAAFGEELQSVLQDVQREAEAVPAEATAALADARRRLRDGDASGAEQALRTLVADYPELVEARRALRSAVRLQKRASEPSGPATGGYPELEATFQATATRQADPLEDAAPTVLQESMSDPARPLDTVQAWPPRERARLRLTPVQWAVTGAALLVVLVSMLFLLLARGGPRPPQVVELPVRSLPTGARVLVDGKDSGVVTNGSLRFDHPVPDEVVVTFRKPGHRDETRTVRPKTAVEALSVTLEATQQLTQVTSDPPGASLTLDGERVAGVTPLELALDPDVEHRLVASLEGHLPQELKVGKGERPATLELQLQKLAPPGTVVVSADYPIEVQWRGRVLARGASTQRVSVPGGRQVLLLLAPDVFLRSEQTVTVPSGGEIELAAPRLGRLNARANPDNCQVFVNGVFADYPPILDRPLAAGRHTVSFRWPDGHRYEQVLEITPGAPAFAFGRRE